MIQFFNLLEAIRGHVPMISLCYDLTPAIAMPWRDPNRAGPFAAKYLEPR
jgi:hypothetical protein